MVEKIFWASLAGTAGYTFVKWVMRTRYELVYRACGV